MEKVLSSFKGDPELKEELMAQLREHYVLDEFAKGVYWQNGKGCFIGCATNKSGAPDNNVGRHMDLEIFYDIPVQLAHVFDCIFERLPNAQAKEFVIPCFDAIPVGVDLTTVRWKVLHWILVDEKFGVINLAESDQVKAAIRAVADGYADLIAGNEVPADRWSEIGKLAREAREARVAREAWVAWEAWEARVAWEAWEARVAREAREAREARVAWVARVAWEAWVARVAREAREAWEARQAWVAWEAREAREAREAWVAWEARVAREAYFPALSEKLIQFLKEAK